MIYPAILFLVFIVFVSVPSVAWSHSPKTDPDSYLRHIPEKKKACLLESQKLWDTGVTQQMMEGNAQYLKCLEKIATQLALQYYPSTAFAPEGFKAQLEKLDEQVESIYWPIHNNLKSCDGACGTMYYLFPGGATAHFLENLILDMAQRIDEGGDIVNDSWVKAYKKEDLPDVTP